MALVATAVGPDHFVGAVSIPVSHHELFVRQMTDSRPAGC